MSDPNPVFTAVSAVLEVDRTEIQISSFSCRYILDSIPTATAVIAAVEDLEVEKLQRDMECEIRLTLRDIDGSEETFVVFKGYTLSLSVAQERGAHSYVLTLVHWLIDLANTSIASHLFSNMAPGNLINPFTRTGSGVTARTARDVAASLPDPTDDIWVSIKRGFELLLENSVPTTEAQEALRAIGIPVPREIMGPAANTHRRAREIIDTLIEADTLKVNPNEPNKNWLAGAMREDITAVLCTPGASQTLWGAFQTLAKRYMFSIVPLPEKVRVVALMPNLKSDLFDHRMQIVPSEYNNIRVTGLSGPPIRGVVLFGTGRGVSGTDIFTPEHIQAIPRPMGLFVTQQVGTLYTAPAPGWLRESDTPEVRDTVSSAAYVPSIASDDEEGSPDIVSTAKENEEDHAEGLEAPELGVDGENPALNDRDDVIKLEGGSEKFIVITPPKSGVSKAYGGGSGIGAAFGAIMGPPAPPPPEEEPQPGRLGDRYAKCLYAHMALAGRHMQVAGKLRFDICPGSSVAVMAPGKFKTGFGIVGGVTLTVDRMKSIAQTSFDVLSFRTYQEDYENASLFDVHPIYTKVFKGEPLIDG